MSGIHCKVRCTLRIPMDYHTVKYLHIGITFEKIFYEFLMEARYQQPRDTVPYLYIHNIITVYCVRGRNIASFEPHV